MEIIEDIIPKGEGIRTGKKLTKLLGLVVHWIGVAQPKASVIRKNFQYEEFGTQYIIDWYTGEIIHCVPDDEVCYHVGSSYGYTDLKEELVGKKNPNWYFVGIECCIDPKTHIAEDFGTPGKYMDLGKPSDAQYKNLVEFAAYFLGKHGLTSDNLYLHWDITGKICHAWFVKDLARWRQFKADVKKRMEGGEEDMTEPEVRALVNEILAQREAETASRPVSDWAKKPWETLTAEGIFDGTAPGMPLTREQAAVAITRLEEKYQD